VADIKVLDLSGRQVGDLTLRDDIFNVTPNKDLLFRYIDMQLANRRQGTACTKTRAEVAGTGRKPFPQKHTGRARQGTLRSPHHRHGGVAFGPKPRDWSKKTEQKNETRRVEISPQCPFSRGKPHRLGGFDDEGPQDQRTERTFGQVRIDRPENSVRAAVQKGRL